jgi:membrane-associated phospholipid phosphatase
MRDFKARIKIKKRNVKRKRIISGLAVITSALLAVLNFSAISPAVYAESATSQVSKETPAGQEPRTENLLSLEYGKLVLDDTWHVLSSPARWNQKEWLWAGLGMGTVVAVGAWADKPIEKEFQKHRTKSNDNFSKAIEPFGAEYSFIVLGVFEVYGLAFHNDNARAVAQDGLASSIIAASIITPSLKAAIGRKRPSQDAGPHEFSPFSGRHSFPSLHATQAFAVASVIAEHYDSPLVKIGSYAVASMVGYARMEQKAHWASDVLAGALIGSLVGREIVHFNRDKRYEISLITDENMVGAQFTHKF